jgi:tRNA-specific 2-thiouridylase
VELETGKILGRHKGYWFHTVGQRKGLGLSGGPWYVIRKDVDANIVWASKGFDTETQYGREFSMRDFHFITENPWENDERDITFKIRHTPDFAKGKILKTPEGYRILSEEKLQGIAPGQFGVVYDANASYCIGSGEII